MRGNKMGPDNQGPKTGRGLGLCNDNDKAGFLSDEIPMGRGRGGFGGGYGRGRAGGIGNFGNGRQMGGRGFNRNALLGEEKLLKRIETLETELAELKGKSVK